MVLLLAGLGVAGFVGARGNARRREHQLKALVAERTEALQEFAAQISSMFESSPLGIGLATLEGDILSANQALLQMSGYSEAEMSRLSVADMYRAPEQRDALLELLREGQVVRDLSTQLKRKDGTPYYASLSVSRMSHADRDVLLAVIEDVTDQVEAEQALRHRAHLLSHVSDAIIASDMDFYIQSWNRGAEEMYGWRADDVIGKTVGEVLRPEYPNDRRETVTEQFLSDEHWEGEVIHRHKDGTPVHILSSVALLKDDEGNPLGVVSANRDITERMQAEAALQEALGAAERARRLETARRQEAERRQQIAEVLGDVVEALNSQEALEEVLDLIARQASELLGADAVVVCELEFEPTLEPDTGEIRVLAENGLPTHRVADGILPSTAEALRRAAASRKVVAVPDRPTSLTEEGETFSASGVDGYQVLLAVPTVVESDSLGGLVLYFTRPRLLSAEERELAELLGNHAALAVENARLREEVEEAAVAAERSRIAGELHDSVTQALYTTNLIAETLPDVWQRRPEEALRALGELRDLTRGALAEMRAMLLELRPRALAGRRLSELLHQLTEAMAARTDLPITVTVTGDCRLPENVRTAFYRIAQEALNNTSKHARAGRAWINLRCDSDGAALRISDNGRGFEPGGVLPQQLGMTLMHERALDIGATLTVESQPERGTEVRVTWSASGGAED